ncbi:hypothetical protein PM082_005477 [Marasmius tenuissimus]|nr:hypothetical protein PM082_005477 [Marasmius tenuissimus]
MSPLPARLASRDRPWWPHPTQLHKDTRSTFLRSTVLDRVKVLGNDRDYGHAGCVNALHWAREGELLLSAGDDTTVQIWRMDPNESSEDYPFKCQTVIHTGHRANIFNAHMLPYSSRIATVAGDKQVRVFDIADDHGSISPPRSDLLDSGKREEYLSDSGVRTHTLHCHSGRVKRIVTENSPDLFLTVAEDGTVRQHDLRAPHTCRSGSCPAPILSVDHELSTIGVSPLTPYQLVVAGLSPYGYLFDRRHTGRILKEEWGMRPNGVTTCVRRFGRSAKDRKKSPSFYSDHITGARMASENGHEVLLSYSGDGVYLYSTLDDPDPPKSSRSMVRPNSKRRRLSGSSRSSESELLQGDERELDTDEESEGPAEASSHGDSGDHCDVEDGDDNDQSDEDDEFQPWVPVVMPRKRYAGARNTRTVKDVNFLGPRDEFVTSGSDDGNFFVWDKSSGDLQGLYEGDGSVVNVIEGHPHLPLIAVSGIDHTVKLFGPARGGPSRFSKMQNAENIMKNNIQASGRDFRTIRNRDFFSLLMALQAHEEGGEDDESEDGTPAECANQ